MKPIIKFVGGKTQLKDEIEKIITPELLKGHTYFEPFFGGGAIALDLEPEHIVINDLNSELINLYTVVRDNIDELITELKILQKYHSNELFYSIRNIDREPDFYKIGAIRRAARTIYLNKTCFNGLYRVNSKGFFNSSAGRTASGKTPDIVNEQGIRQLHDYLVNKDVTILNGSYEDAVITAKAGDTVYFDPPYDYEDEKGFVGYQKEGFNHDDLLNLKKVCDNLVNLGCNVIISNNLTNFVLETFKNYEIKEISARRSINSDGKNRNSGKEVIIFKLNNEIR